MQCNNTFKSLILVLNSVKNNALKYTNVSFNSLSEKNDKLNKDFVILSNDFLVHFIILFNKYIYN